jgi:hypothetical protein
VTAFEIPDHPGRKKACPDMPHEQLMQSSFSSLRTHTLRISKGCSQFLGKTAAIKRVETSQPTAVRLVHSHRQWRSSIIHANDPAIHTHQVNRDTSWRASLDEASSTCYTTVRLHFEITISVWYITASAILLSEVGHKVVFYYCTTNNDISIFNSRVSSLLTCFLYIIFSYRKKTYKIADLGSFTSPPL